MLPARLKFWYEAIFSHCRLYQYIFRQADFLLTSRELSFFSYVVWKFWVFFIKFKKGGFRSFWARDLYWDMFYMGMSKKSNLLRENFNLGTLTLYCFLRKDVICCALITLVLLQSTLKSWYLKFLSNFRTYFLPLNNILMTDF